MKQTLQEKIKGIIKMYAKPLGVGLSPDTAWLRDMDFLAGDILSLIETERKEYRYYNVKIPMYRLDWIKILDTAIKNRRTSWGEDPVYEWRNASDEISYAVINAMEEAGIFPKDRIVLSKQSTEDKKPNQYKVKSDKGKETQ